MKRDMDLIRLILLQIEETHFDTALYGLEIEGYDNATIFYLPTEVLHIHGTDTQMKSSGVLK